MIKTIKLTEKDIKFVSHEAFLYTTINLAIAIATQKLLAGYRDYVVNIKAVNTSRLDSLINVTFEYEYFSTY